MVIYGGINNARVMESTMHGLWNRLPDDRRLTTDIDFFKKHLKTYLFSLSFLSNDDF